MATGANARAVLLLVLLCVVQRSGAIWLNLPASGTKCVSEEIQSNVVVVADYVVISDDHAQATPTISAKVRVIPFPKLLPSFSKYLICSTLFLHV